MKKVRVSRLAYLLSFQTTCLMLLLFLLFSFSVSKHHNILISTYEVIIVAKSSNLAMFFLFNAILIMIRLGSSKPPAEEFDGLFSFPSLEYGFKDSKEKENDNPKELNLEKDEDDDGEEDRDNGDRGYDGYDEDNDDDDDDDDDDAGEEDEDDDCRDIELERRIEEFIAKVHMERRTTRLKNM